MKTLVSEDDPILRKQGQPFDFDNPQEDPEKLKKELYEAALKGLNIDIVDDKAEQCKALVQEVKKRIYERVIRRLLSESKK